MLLCASVYAQPMDFESAARDAEMNYEFQDSFKCDNTKDVAYAAKFKSANVILIVYDGDVRVYYDPSKPRVSTTAIKQYLQQPQCLPEEYIDYYFAS